MAELTLDSVVGTVGASAAAPVLVPQSGAAAAPQVSAPVDDAPSVAALRFKSRANHMDDLDSQLVSRVNKLYDLAPPEIRDHAEISSARRTGEEQAAAYNRYVTGQAGIAAPPGQSRHERGGAFDFSSGGRSNLFVQWMNSPDGQKAMSSVGLETLARLKDPGHVQMSDDAKGGERVSAQRASDSKSLDTESVLQALAGVPKAGSASSAISPIDNTPVEQPFDVIADPESGTLISRTGGSFNSALVNGVRKGMTDVPMGAAQAALPEAVFKPVQDAYNEFNSRFSELEEQHPNADFAGRIAGATAAILLGARALGPVAGPAAARVLPATMARAISGALEFVGPVGRGALAGAAIGGTEYYKDGTAREQRPLGINARMVDSAIGGTFGALGGVVARGVGWAAENLSKRFYGDRFLQTLNDTAAGITKNTEAPLNDALSYYRQVEQRASARYNLRTATGRTFEGYPSGVGTEIGGRKGLSQAIDGALRSSRQSGVETRAVTQGTVSRVRSILGLDKEEGRFAEWKVLRQQFQEQTVEAQRARMQHPLAGAFATNPHLLGQLEAAGAFPATPIAPPAWEAAKVSATQYAAARTAINRSIRSTRDPAARTQLGMLLGGIDDVAKAEAAEYGMGAAEFARRAQAADKFYRETVAPLRGFFGGRTSTEAAGRPGVPLDGMTPAKFYDAIVKTIDSDDVKYMTDLAKVLGPEGRSNIKMIAASQALLSSEGVAGEASVRKAYRYVQKHEEVLRALLGRDEYTQLAGMGKIADEVAEQFQRTSKSGGIFDYSHSLGPAFAMYQAFHGHFLKATGTILALPAYHAAMRFLQNVHTAPIVEPLVRRAATMTPGSVPLQQLIRNIERRIRQAAVPAERITSP